MRDLTTPRLTLRLLEEGDADTLFEHFTHPDVTRYLLDEEPFTSIEQVRDLIRFFSAPSGKGYNRWGITITVTGQLIGTCGFHQWNRRDRRAEVGYDLHPGFWGHGYMSEALRAAIHYGFTTMDLHRIAAVVHPENTPSVRLLQRLGFRLEGILRDYHRAHGRYHSHDLYSLLEEDWSSGTSTLYRPDGS
jgi:[ribosomal protein S5]-alanine N-acetyltransferase